MRAPALAARALALLSPRGSRALSGDAARAASEAVHGVTAPRSKAMRRAMAAAAPPARDALAVAPPPPPPALAHDAPPPPAGAPAGFGAVLASNMVMGFAMSLGVAAVFGVLRSVGF